MKSLRVVIRSIRSVRVLFDKNKVRVIRLIRAENSLMTAIRFVFLNELRRKDPVPLKIFGETLFVRTNSPDLSVATTSLGGEFSILSNTFPKDHAGLIIDAGGYIGSAAIAFSKMFPSATIVTVEPSTENFSVLSMNVAMKGTIHPVKAALVPHGAEVKVKLQNRGTGEWGFTTVKEPRDRSSTYIEDVETISIESILARFGFQTAMIIKMDIEGAEQELFRRPNWLASTAVLMVELHERIAEGVTELFHRTNAGRNIYKSVGEKYVSVNESLQRREAGVSAQSSRCPTQT